MNFSHEDFAVIASLDLEPIKVKLMHRESGESWSLERANAVEFEYRRFLFLMKKYPTEQAAPSRDVDTFWHYHILDTINYAQDCQAVFGYFLHHFPYLGLRGEDDLLAHERVGERMRDLYEETFGEDYPVGGSNWGGAGKAYSVSTAGTAYSVATATAYSVATATAYSVAPNVVPLVRRAAATAYAVATTATATAHSAKMCASEGDGTTSIRGTALSDFFSVRPRLQATT